VKIGRVIFDGDDPVDVMAKLGLTDGAWLLSAGAALFAGRSVNADGETRLG
jgi:hypothetical protein